MNSNDEWEQMSPAERRTYNKVCLLSFGVVFQILIDIMVIILVIVGVTGCSASRKLSEIKSEQMSAQLVLPEDREPQALQMEEQRDTLVVSDFEGREVIIMKAVKDENGEMVATDQIDAAYVTARFRNVAERAGKVNLEFQIRVPEKMQDSEWQLRFRPKMVVLEDTLDLAPVYITGENYRRAQLRGYEQYQRFLDRIISDTTKFINVNLLEIFIKRNIPQLYAFKTDSTFVSDEQLASIYGVTEQDAIEHYTDKIGKQANECRKARRQQVFERYVKAPIETEVRLDTVITAGDGDFIYNYTQTITTRPKLRKVDILLSGEIFQQSTLLYTIPTSEPLTFYISSLSAFVDSTPRDDENYMAGVKAIIDHNYAEAITILGPYQDYNVAIAFCAMGYDASALSILEAQPRTDKVNYMLAILYARKARDQEAVQCYLQACRQNSSYIHRGNLDPEISTLIERYDIHSQFIN